MDGLNALLRKMQAEREGGGDNVSKQDKVGMLRLHNMQKLLSKTTSTRFECQAQLLSAASELGSDYWPKQWDNKDDHIAYLEASIKAANTVLGAKTAAQVAVAFDAVEPFRANIDTKLSDATFGLLKRIVDEVLLTLARSDAKAWARATEANDE